MKVLWFEVTEPAAYKNDGAVIGGWQDSLEHIVKECKNIELYVAFESSTSNEVKRVNGVTYIPLNCHYTITDKIVNTYSWGPKIQKIVELGVKVVEQYNPDIIHIFGNEWPFGLIAPLVSKPVIIHIQGSIVPYYNALYPPGYNIYTELFQSGLNPKRWLSALLGCMKWRSRLQMEHTIWKSVHYYMGRTVWDKALVNTLTKDAQYFHVEEALRPSILCSDRKWALTSSSKLKLISTGCSTLWKGIDVMLKTAHVLKEAGVDFEWIVAGKMPEKLKRLVERKERLKFAENGIQILGFVTPDALKDLLCSSTMYVHTAYIENSPNSICEAQVLGVPVVSTMVGGISTLVRHEVDGILVPTNDPWLLADTILELSKDEKRMKMYSENGRGRALQRHDYRNILNQLLVCYQSILKE